MVNSLEIRNRFPQLKSQVHNRPLVYLDNAASTLKVDTVINSINNHYSNEVANIHRGVHFLSENGTALYEQTRTKAAEFINAKDRSEMIFTKGTTDGLNLVAQSLGEIALKAGDEILLSTMEHHSNIVPWQIIAEKKGAKVIEIPIDDSGDIDQQAYKNLLSDKTKIVSIVHCSNSLGTINPIEEMIPVAHEKGAFFVVDAAQSIAHQKIDVQDLGCDFLVFSSHKMFGPTGIGFLYGKKEILDKMPPYQGGGDMIDVVTFEKTTYNDLPHKFEAGTPHIAGGIAFLEAFKFLDEIGVDEIFKYEHELLNHFETQLKEFKGVRIIGQAKNKGPVCSFVVDQIHPHDLGTLLDQNGIAVRTGHHCTQPLMKRFGITGTTRASFSIYNTKEEIDLFFKSFKNCLEMLS